MLYSILVLEAMKTISWPAGKEGFLIFGFYLLLNLRNTGMKIFCHFLFWVLLNRWNLRAFHGRESLLSCPIQKENHYHIIIAVRYGLFLLYVALMSAPQSVAW